MNDVNILFPDQGIEYIGMGKSLYDCYPEVKQVFHQADKVLGYSLSNLIFYGKPDKLSKPSYSNPAIVTVGFAFYTLLKKHFNFRVNSFLGEGIGEISALACAEILSFSDAVLLAEKRGEMFKNSDYGENGTLSMVNLRALSNTDDSEYFKLLTSKMKIAKKEQQDKVRLIRKECLIKASDIKENQVENWKQAIAQVSFSSKNFIDIGPGSSFFELVKAINPDLNICALDFQGDPYYSLSIFQDHTFFNNQYLLEKLAAVAVSSENKCFNEKKFKEGVVRPCNNLKMIIENISKKSKLVEDDDIKKAKEELITVLKTKGLSVDEINQRLKKIQDETLISF